MDCLSDDVVRLNYENVTDRRIKPVTILKTKEERLEDRLNDGRAFLMRGLQAIMLNKLRRARNVRDTIA